MQILKTRNIIIKTGEVKIVPLSDNLNNIETVKSIVKDVLRDKNLENKNLTITGYLINDTETSMPVNKNLIKNIYCPFRGLYRTIK